MTDPRRQLPAVGVLLERPDVRALGAAVPRALLAEATRRAVAAVRDGSAPPADGGWGALVQRELAQLQRPSLRPVLNATGVVLHTNLGRAPLAPAALAAIARVAGGGCNLEYDLERGERGSRYVHCVDLLRELTGADDAIVVNNCAAALVLALNTFARGREAIVSRGELVEIGGSFRVPDIMERSGAILREVGTTNRTHLADYQDALGERTGAIVKVHRSNFAQTGFVADTRVRDLAKVAAAHGIALLHDFGSGLLVDLSGSGLSGEPLARDVVREGATLVLMSGDKLLGGPQAGILVGDGAAVAACRRNPLCRALRVDKLTLAALAATLELSRDPDVARREIPVLAMLSAPVAQLRERAATMARALVDRGIDAEAVASEATVGGGAFPTARIPSAAVRLAGNAEQFEARLRLAELAVVGRIERGALLLDLRSVALADDSAMTSAVLAALAGTAS